MCSLGHIDILIDYLLRFQYRTLLFWYVCISLMPQTLAEICRNMGICYGFKAVVARKKYLGFILLHDKRFH